MKRVDTLAEFYQEQASQHFIYQNTIGRAKRKDHLLGIALVNSVAAIAAMTLPLAALSADYTAASFMYQHSQPLAWSILALCGIGHFLLFGYQFKERIRSRGLLNIPLLAGVAFAFAEPAQGHFMAALLIFTTALFYLRAFLSERN